MIQWEQCYDCWTIVSIFKQTDVFRVHEMEFGRLVFSDSYINVVCFQPA